MQWKYYNHALIPTTPPHITADTEPIKNGTIWNCGGGGRHALLARWTTNYDCGYETEWYYCIKDTPFRLEKIKSKYRCDINRGLRNFSVKRIEPHDYVQEIWEINNAAYTTYPRANRPKQDYNKFRKEVLSGWKDCIVFGAFEQITGKMVSYSMFWNRTNYISFAILKSNPEYERLKVNAAMVASCLEYFNDDIQNGMYICDGERNISHQTAFQDYLIRTFGFRKAYCMLHIAYPPVIKIIVRALFPFRKFFERSSGKLGHNIYGVLYMEEICRNQSINIKKPME